MQITHECLEYDLMTKIRKVYATNDQHCHKETLVFVTNTYLTNSQKVKASAENVHLWYKYKLADVYAIHWCELHQ